MSPCLVQSRSHMTVPLILGLLAAAHFEGSKVMKEFSESVWLPPNEMKKSSTSAKYLGPFIIHHCINNGAYILQDITGNIFPDKVSPSALKLVDPNTSFEDKHFKVEKVLNYDSPPFDCYLMKWKGYLDSDNS
ncbi:hypothetical protein QOT17_016716 [Balamuthia mandrillaris]